MKSFDELKQAIASNKKMVWNDPDFIEGNDYTITYIEPIDDDFERDNPILIQYGEGSEAQVFLHEILLADNTEDNMQTYSVSLTFTDIQADNPLEAAKTILKWLVDAETMTYDVEDELTGNKFTVDLAEEDEDAVLPNND